MNNIKQVNLKIEDELHKITKVVHMDEYWGATLEMGVVIYFDGEHYIIKEDRDLKSERQEHAFKTMRDMLHKVARMQRAYNAKKALLLHYMVDTGLDFKVKGNEIMVGFISIRLLNKTTQLINVLDGETITMYTQGIENNKAFIHGMIERMERG